MKNFALYYLCHCFSVLMNCTASRQYNWQTYGISAAFCEDQVGSKYLLQLQVMQYVCGASSSLRQWMQEKCRLTTHELQNLQIQLLLPEI